MKHSKYRWNRLGAPPVCGVAEITFAHFHVVKMLCTVVDRIRQSEMNTIALEKRQNAYYSRFLWLFFSHKHYIPIVGRRVSVWKVLPETRFCRATWSITGRHVKEEVYMRGGDGKNHSSGAHSTGGVKGSSCKGGPPSGKGGYDGHSLGDYG